MQKHFLGRVHQSLHLASAKELMAQKLPMSLCGDAFDSQQGSTITVIIGHPSRSLVALQLSDSHLLKGSVVISKLLPCYSETLGSN